MIEVSPWTLWFLAELSVVSLAALAYVAWASLATLSRVRDREPVQVVEAAAPPPAPVELEDFEVDAADEGRPAEIRAKVRRSVEQVEEALGPATAAAQSTSAALMGILEKQAHLVARVGRLNGEGALPPELKEQTEAILAEMREMDPLVIDAQERLDQVEASLQTSASELAQYGAQSGFEWNALRPSPAGLNRVLVGKAQAPRADDPGQEVAIPAALADAIDQALI
jgi:hypothetical protein